MAHIILNNTIDNMFHAVITFLNEDFGDDTGEGQEVNDTIFNEV